MPWRLIWRLLLSIPLDLVIGLATGSSLIFAIGEGIFEIVILDVICPSLSFFEVEAFGVLANETEHLIAAAIDYEQESDRERDAHARALARENPHSIYLYGDFSVVDAGLLASSAYVVAQSELPETVFQVAVGLLEFL